jgi:hypothetical protein
MAGTRGTKAAFQGRDGHVAGTLCVLAGTLAKEGPTVTVVTQARNKD